MQYDNNGNDNIIYDRYDDGDTLLMRSIGRYQVDLVRYLAALGVTRYGLHDEVTLYLHVKRHDTHCIILLPFRL